MSGQTGVSNVSDGLPDVLTVFDAVARSSEVDVINVHVLVDAGVVTASANATWCLSDLLPQSPFHHMVSHIDIHLRTSFLTHYPLLFLSNDSQATARKVSQSPTSRILTPLILGVII